MSSSTPSSLCEPPRARLLCMLSLTFAFFVMEVVVSRVTSSLAMLSDSFHMLSDVIALVVAIVAARFSERTAATDRNTFGWVRAEVMGALVNAVFLSALCVTVLLEAASRFAEPHAIESPRVVLVAGAAGLALNLVGLCMFRGHAHGGGGHGHSHGGGGGGHGHAHGGKKNKKGNKTDSSCNNSEETNNLVPGQSTGRTDSSQAECVDVQLNGNTAFDDIEQERSQEASSQLNMRGVFLHVLGDALGSVIVVINAIIFSFVWQPCEPGVPCINPCVDSQCLDHQHLNTTSVGFREGYDNNSNPEAVSMAGPCWVLYLDPSLCVIMVGILMYTTYPLLKESALILLQTVPKQIDIHGLSSRLRELDGVLAVHELHIWQLAGSRIIATAHIKCHDPTAYMDVAKRIKGFFHDEGIHATTIQPEFVTVNSESRASLCELSCRTQCALKLCCGSADGSKAPESAPATSTASTTPTTGQEAVLEVISESLETTTAPKTDKDVTLPREVESSL
ncbi:zinc transporter 1a [Hoplias malabaricus]|uniref:zinc transporter 1a n=1 Tax=Hoplias malabaricus TaxID=27720 RepID=UPI00346353AB